MTEPVLVARHLRRELAGDPPAMLVADADLAVFGENWDLERVYLAGEPALEEGRPCRFSYFERDLRDDGKGEGSCSR